MKNKKIICGMLMAIVVISSGGCRSKETSSANNYKIKARELSEPIDKINEANNKVALKFFKEVAKGNNENIIISPLSMNTVLSLTMNGADGKTKEEMLTALELNDIEDKNINESYKNAIAHFNSLKTIETKLGNSIWIDNKIELNNEFEDIGKSNYEAEINSVDFAKKSTLNDVNKWVSDKTAGKIKKIVDKFDDGTAMALINTVYFKGKWAKSFEKIFEGNFNPSKGSSYMTDMMSQTSSFDYFKGINFSAVRLPYEDNTFGMYVFLPDKGSSVDQFMKDMSYDNLQVWTNGFEPKQVVVQIPKFKIEYEKKLNDILIGFGMKSAFSNGANFSRITKDKNNLYIDIIKQKAFIEVNETGTEAAATTIETMKFTSVLLDKPTEFIADRPFIYVLQDKKTGLIMFMGKVEKP